MLIKVEPAGFFMYTVQLIFDLECPDSEDGTVRDYLADNALEPRYQSTGPYEGRECEVLQFGGCYLGRHLQSVGQLQRQAVEAELLTAAVEGHLAALEPELSGRPGGADRRELVVALVAEFHQESAFQPNDAGELAAILDREAVRKAAQRWLEIGR